MPRDQAHPARHRPRASARGGGRSDGGRPPRRFRGTSTPGPPPMLRPPRGRRPGRRGRGPPSVQARTGASSRRSASSTRTASDGSRRPAATSPSTSSGRTTWTRAPCPRPPAGAPIHQRDALDRPRRSTRPGRAGRWCAPTAAGRTPAGPGRAVPAPTPAARGRLRRRRAGADRPGVPRSTSGARPPRCRRPTVARRPARCCPPRSRESVAGEGDSAGAAGTARPHRPSVGALPGGPARPPRRRRRWRTAPRAGPRAGCRGRLPGPMGLRRPEAGKRQVQGIEPAQDEGAPADPRPPGLEQAAPTGHGAHDPLRCSVAHHPEQVVDGR